MSRFFGKQPIENVIKECDEIIEKVIRPVLQRDGSDVVFHTIQDGCAVITLEGEAAICDCEKCTAIPEEILQVFQQYFPDDITAIRRKLDYED
ncbi:NifU-like domain containing protein [Tritrichomonas foetus]|uniref:NifU-like domain containing protein n=1 Tax=Tritrichomonas foetus TaxID=1144522 RepID=A0A1J4KYJ6_9EUKA|nr:NifU-like domain containing protein [Tritrichomonas foetus]|eukprot:OHT16311.1 NifU-like domain containing protein [Tritrichomonas foetus]